MSNIGVQILKNLSPQQHPNASCFHKHNCEEFMPMPSTVLSCLLIHCLPKSKLQIPISLFTLATQNSPPVSGGPAWTERTTYCKNQATTTRVPSGPCCSDTYTPTTPAVLNEAATNNSCYHCQCSWHWRASGINSKVTCSTIMSVRRQRSCYPTVPNDVQHFL